MGDKDKKNLKRRHSNSNKDECDLETDTENVVKRISIELKDIQAHETDKKIDNLNLDTLNALKSILQKELAAVVHEFEISKEESNDLNKNVIHRTNHDQVLSDEDNTASKVSEVFDELEDYDEIEDLTIEAVEDLTHEFFDDSEGDSYSDYEYETEEEHPTRNITRTREESDDPYF